MAFLRVKARGSHRYYYIVESRRSGATVRQKIVEYLGDRPTAARVAAARRYWKVGAKRKAKGGGR
jgi:hypothetical protein